MSETGCLHSKSSDTPLEISHKLQPDVGEPLEDQGKYRRPVGKLIYLTVTRTDLTFQWVLSASLWKPLRNLIGMQLWGFWGIWISF